MRFSDKYILNDLVLVYNLVALTGPKLNLMSSQSRSFNRLFGHKHPSRKVSTNAYYATHLPVFQPYNFTQVELFALL